MELRQVQYFLGVAQAGTFARAADDLHVAKSALSKQIKLLEDELGAELLLRGAGRREVELTPAGEAFLAEAVTIVEAMEHGREAIRDLAGPGHGRVTVIFAAGWEAFPGWPDMLTEFRRRHPAIEQMFTQAESIEAILGAVTSGTADLGIFADTRVPSVPGLAVDVLAVDRLHVGVPPGHRLAKRTEVELSELRDERWLLAPIEHSIVARLTALDGFEPNVVGAGPSTALVRTMLLEGAGISVHGESEAPFWDPAASLAVEPRTDVSIMCACRRGYRSAATRTSRDFLRECFGWSGSNNSD